MKKVPVHNGQCLQDITIRETGGLEGIFDQALLNGFSITEDFTVVTEMFLEEKIISSGIVQYYKNRNIQPATSLLDLVGKQIFFERGFFETGLFE